MEQLSGWQQDDDFDPSEAYPTIERLMLDDDAHDPWLEGYQSVQACMSEFVDAIYENGILRPLSPLDLSDHARVQIAIRESPTEDDSVALDRQQAAVDEMLAEFAKLPIPANDDGFSGADHDAVLYGKPA